MNAHSLKYIILECGELYEIMDDELTIEEHNKELYETKILPIDDEITNVIEQLEIAT